jgi:hypothetical protein
MRTVLISLLSLSMEVSLSMPVKTVPECIAYAKANPGKPQHGFERINAGAGDAEIGFDALLRSSGFGAHPSLILAVRITLSHFSASAISCANRWAN